MTQRLFAYVGVIILYPIFYLCLRWQYSRLSLELLAVRKEFISITQDNDHPILICPNHLTYVDSILLFFIFGSFWNYLFHFKTHAWNFPTLKNMRKNWFYRTICYVGKCQAIERQGSPAQSKKMMQTANYLLSCGDTILIFPEGTRSRTGKVDTQNFMYGVGNLLLEVPQTKTLCVYLRASSQKICSNYPAKGDSFYCRIRLIEPKTQHKGLRASKDISTQIVHTLAQMEEEYFSLQSTAMATQSPS